MTKSKWLAPGDDCVERRRPGAHPYPVQAQARFGRPDRPVVSQLVTAPATSTVTVPTDLISVQDGALITHTHPDVIYRRIADGTLRCWRIGSRRGCRISLSELLVPYVTTRRARKGKELARPPAGG